MKTVSLEIARINTISGIIVIEKIYQDRDDDGDFETSIKREQYSVPDFLEAIFNNFHPEDINGQYPLDWLETIETDADLARAWNHLFKPDREEGIAFTLENINARDREQERKALERIASEVMFRYQLDRIDSVEAIKAIEDALGDERRNLRDLFSDEQRRDRFTNYGGNRHQFFEDEQYLVSRKAEWGNKLETLLGYIAKYFPLLWAEYERSQFDSLDEVSK